MTTRSVTHDTFVIERSYPASPARVFHAFADPETKKMWFHGPDGWAPDEGEMDFRVGGRETSRGGPPDGWQSFFDCRYHEIIENERIVFTYDMYVNDVQLSVSLTTIELHADGDGTRLTYTEHGAYFDGQEDPSLRREGTEGLFEQLGAFLASQPANA